MWQLNLLTKTEANLSCHAKNSVSLMKYWRAEKWQRHVNPPWEGQSDANFLAKVAGRDLPRLKSLCWGKGYGFERIPGQNTLTFVVRFKIPVQAHSKFKKIDAILNAWFCVRRNRRVQWTGVRLNFVCVDLCLSFFSCCSLSFLWRLWTFWCSAGLSSCTAMCLRTIYRKTTKPNSSWYVAHYMAVFLVGNPLLVVPSSICLVLSMHFASYESTGMFSPCCCNLM